MPKVLKRFGNFIKDHWKTFLTMAVLIVLGVIVSAFTVRLEHRFHKTPKTTTETAAETSTETTGETATKPATKTAAELVWWQALSLTLLDHAGVGLFAAAILGVLIELPHMHDYFQDRIQNTIINRNFIKQLSPSEQERLQEQALEAFFGVEELGQEGGFYKFYTQKIRSHIAGAFRTGTTFETRVAHDANGDLYRVTESISYTCKKGSEGLPKEVRWTTEADEIEELLHLDISAKKPEKDARDEVYSFDKTTGYCHRSLVNYKPGHGYILPLDEYASSDELAITVTATYTVPRERAFSWTMPLPSDSFSGDISFPADLEIFVDLFGLDESALPGKADLQPENGIYKYPIKHDTWLLPDDGFSFHFRQRKQPVARPAAEPAAPAPEPSAPEPAPPETPAAPNQ